MHTLLGSLMFAGLCAVLIGLIVGTLWTLLFGGRVLFLLHSRHPDTWRAMEFQPSAVGLIYSPNFHKWLKADGYKHLGDTALSLAAHRLKNPWPAVVAMAIGGIVAVAWGYK
jgi:hypothetical protein